MKRVLVADDTNNIRMLLTACLQAEGYAVLTAANGEEAQDILLCERLDLAFIDVKMPLLSGTQVLKNIREKGVQTPVVVMTAFATVKNAIDCTRYGAAVYLQKPFTAAKVKAVIAELESELSKTDPNRKKAPVLPGNTGADAEQELDRLLRRLSTESENAEIYRMIGELYKAEGQREKAEKFFRCSNIFTD